MLSSLLSLALLLQTPAPATQAAPAARDVPDLLYRTVDGVELRLDVAVPAGAGPHPVVVLVHGGAWMHGRRQDMRELVPRLTQHGFACVSPSYRLAPAHVWPAQIEDCLYAVQFARAHAAEYGLDPERVGALGPSAGGHLVMMLGVLDERRAPDDPDPVRRQSTRLACAVPYFGCSLLTRTRERDFDTLPPPELFGKDADDAAYASASPLSFVTRDDPPFLLVHGDADEDVPVQHSRLLHEALRAAGVASELVEVPGGGHGDFLFTDPDGAYWTRTLAFLEANLAPRAPAK